ncbi:MAG: hypothetical protein KDB03_29055, partial [Planctomycetales bacterium]|nr:hypothetical protein [Planctomycetales bacterium]
MQAGIEETELEYVSALESTTFDKIALAKPVAPRNLNQFGGAPVVASRLSHGWCIVPRTYVRGFNLSS